MYVLDFSPASGPHMNSRWAFAAIATERMCGCGCRGWHTLQELFRVLVWDLHHCSRGSKPKARHDNEELKTKSGEMPCLATVRISGDWEFIIETFRFRTWAHERICWRCDATREGGAAPWTDVGPEAAWRATRVQSTAEFIGRNARVAEPSWLLAVPGFDFQMIAVDVLHTLCLGVTGTIVGSLFWEWCRERQKPSMAQAVLELNARLLDYNAVTSRLRKNFASVPQITVGMLRPKDGWAGQLSTVKGAEARGLVGLAYKPSLASTGRAADNEMQYRALRHDCVSGLRDIYASLEETPFEPERCAAASRLTFEILRELNTKAREPGRPEPPAWHMLPKVHLAQELCEFQCFRLGNPRNYWCYRDEWFMGVVKRICLSTTHPRTMERMLRYKLDIVEWLESRFGGYVA